MGICASNAEKQAMNPTPAGNADADPDAAAGLVVKVPEPDAQVSATQSRSGANANRKYSTQSVGAMDILTELDLSLNAILHDVQEIKARLTLEALRNVDVRGKAFREVGDTGARLNKVELKKDQVFTGPLTSGKDDARAKRKEIQKRIDEGVAELDIVKSRIKQAKAEAAEQETTAEMSIDKIPEEEESVVEDGSGNGDVAADTGETNAVVEDTEVEESTDTTDVIVEDTGEDIIVDSE